MKSPTLLTKELLAIAAVLGVLLWLGSPIEAQEHNAPPEAVLEEAEHLEMKARFLREAGRGEEAREHLMQARRLRAIGCWPG